MAIVSVTHTFVDATTAEAAEVNTNFDDLVTFVNDSIIHKDGSKAMTADLNMGTNKITNLVDPTADQDAATKVFALRTAIGAKDANIGFGSTSSFVDVLSESFVPPAAWVTYGLILRGSFFVSTDDRAAQGRAEIGSNNGTTMNTIDSNIKDTTIVVSHYETGLSGTQLLAIAAKHGASSSFAATHVELTYVAVRES